MKHALLIAVLTALLLGNAQAALQTTCLDGVMAEVVVRDAALSGDLDKAEKKEKKAYAKVQKTFAKASTSAKQDAKYMKSIVSALAKVWVDQDGIDLLTGAVNCFFTELEGELNGADLTIGFLGDGNKKKGKAVKAAAKARQVLDDGAAADELKVRAKFLTKGVSGVGKCTKATGQALDLEGPLPTHAEAFLRTNPDGYRSADSCTTAGCHPGVDTDLMATGHWNWEGVAANIEGHEGGVHGKTDLINNFCIAIPSNEGRCTQCHAGAGWKDNTFDFTNTEAIDCLVCHDTTGTYKKNTTTAGAPVPGIDLQNVAVKVGKPSRANCGACHFNAGGGDNVKHGDLSSDIVNTTRAFDVHMGTDGADYSCQECHTSTDHGIAGMSLHSVAEGQIECTTTCHQGSVHDDANLNTHTNRVACQSCHIPTFARALPTKLEWYWNEAGQNVDPIPTDEYGKPLYDKKKGRFVWGMNVVPELMWHNGKWNRKIIGVDDAYDTLPAVLASPVGDKDDPGSKLYPFKKMIGKQPADAVSKVLLVPHLFGMGPGPNPYWKTYDWQKALEEGAAYAGQGFSGTYEFVDTVMYLSVNHEVAPKENARKCSDCHFGGIDFTKLGYAGDPAVR